MTTSLPQAITAVAFRATNGELAWRRQDIAAALAAIVETGQAILGGEVWWALGDGRWEGCIPLARGGPPAVWPWDTAPRADGEGWQAYCRRTADESVRAVAGMRVEDEFAPEVRDQLFFNVTYVTEVEAVRRARVK